MIGKAFSRIHQMVICLGDGAFILWFNYLIFIFFIFFQCLICFWCISFLLLLFFFGLVFELDHVFGLVYGWTKNFRSTRSGRLGPVNPTGSKLDQKLRIFLVYNVFSKGFFWLQGVSNTSEVYFNRFSFREIWIFAKHNL